MGVFKQLVRNFINRNSRQYGDPYEFCPRCDDSEADTSKVKRVHIKNESCFTLQNSI